MGNIIFGILFIIGGLSGSMALRGTGSAGALAAVGAVLCIIGFFQMSAKSEKKTERPETRSRPGTGRIGKPPGRGRRD